MVDDGKIKWQNEGKIRDKMKMLMELLGSRTNRAHTTLGKQKIQDAQKTNRDSFQEWRKEKEQIEQEKENKKKIKEKQNENIP